MRLIQKLKGLKKIPQVLMFSAAIATATGGCATVENVEHKYRPTGIEKEVIVNSTLNKKEIIEFNISSPYVENKIPKVKIKESLKEINSQLKSIKTEKKYEEVAIERREIMKPYHLILPLLSGAAGAGAGWFLYPEGEYNGMLYGFLLGLGAGVWGMAELGFEPEFKEIKTGKTKSEFSDERIEEEVLNERLIYDNNPAININVKFSGKGLVSKIYKTDNSGALNFLHIAESFNPRYFFGTNSKNFILERIEDIDLVQQIRPNIRDLFKEELYDEISPKKITFTLKTDELSTLKRKVKNDSRTFNWEGYQLTDDAIYQVIREFVDDEINSRIKSLEFTVKDAVSHIPINGSNFELETEAPSKADLAGRYFTQELKDYAKKYIADYLIGNTTIWDSPETISFEVYSPARIFLEVTHPDYNFVSGQVLVKNKDAKKTVYMVDKGSKIRIQDANNERGRIE